MRLPDPTLPWPIVWPGVIEIASSESCALEPYQDIAGIWTNGWGETLDVVPGEAWTQQQADERLCQRLTEFTAGVQARLQRLANPYQLAALVSLAYNIGLQAFAGSSVLKAHNRGDFAAAARAFALWNKARVKGRLQEVRGLTLRRAREAALYGRNDVATVESVARLQPATALGESPDAAPESRLMASPIAQSGAVSVATGAMATAGAVSQDVRSVADGLGMTPLLVIGVVALVVGGIVIWQRYQQRKGGWA